MSDTAGQLIDTSPIAPRFSRVERLERASLRAAMLIRGHWEELGNSDTRYLEAPILPDDLTVIGQSHSWSGKGRREHVIPRLLVITECLRLLKVGANDQMLATFIAGHTKIVRISRDECERLDRRAGVGLGLRQCMPADWSFGDDPFARLTVAGIAWDPITILTPSSVPAEATAR
tara:strand:- start:10032 stop:10556 length:525 start_codon:yes stop_codon:yes gene_type:complete